MAVWVHERAEDIGADLFRILRSIRDIAAATAEISGGLPLPGPLRIGAGVNTGPAIVGGADYTALGDTVNAAFRLETATKGLGMGIALGERAWQELAEPKRAAFARRQVELKGYEGQSTAWAISFEGLRDLLDRFPE
jgi:adenylate cyclase